MRPRTQIAALAVVMIIAIGTAVLPAMADTTSSEGSFDLSNAAPSVTRISLNTPTGVMTPQVDNRLEIDISDANTLNDISEIQVIIKTNTTATSADDNVTDKATYRWTPTGNWSLVGPTNSTWGFDSSLYMYPDLDATAGTWQRFPIPGK